MDSLKILIISQVIPQWYVDLIKSALPDNTEIDCITGSDVSGVFKIKSPEYVTSSFKTKFISWIKYSAFVLKWSRNNKKNRYDLVFGVSNPPLNAFTGVKLGRKFKAPFVFMNWDIYPQNIESAFANPVIRFVCKIWHKLNCKYYPRIDSLITIGEIMAESINKGLKKPVDVTVLPIAVDTEDIKPVSPEENVFRTQTGLTDKFVVLYSGNMGHGHNIGIVLDAAEKLKDKENISFVLIGGGQQFESIKERISRENLGNVKLFPWQPADVFPYSVACGDVAVVTEETKYAHLFMPSRTYSMMAAGEAIIGVCSDYDDLNLLITRYGVGDVVTDNSAETLAQKISYFADNPEKLEECQVKSREIAEKVYALPVISEGYKRIFDRLLTK